MGCRMGEGGTRVRGGPGVAQCAGMGVQDDAGSLGVIGWGCRGCWDRVQDGGRGHQGLGGARGAGMRVLDGCRGCCDRVKGVPGVQGVQDGCRVSGDAGWVRGFRAAWGARARPAALPPPPGGARSPGPLTVWPVTAPPRWPGGRKRKWGR